MSEAPVKGKMAHTLNVYGSRFKYKEYMAWAGKTKVYLKNVDLTEHNQVKYFKMELN
jgi:hypothetical protein